MFLVDMQIWVNTCFRSNPNWNEASSTPKSANVMTTDLCHDVSKFSTQCVEMCKYLSIALPTIWAAKLIINFFLHRKPGNKNRHLMGFPRGHYSDVIMGAIGAQSTSVSIVYLTICSGANQRKTSKLRVTGLCGGNSPVTGEFPAQRASDGENVSI